MTVNRNTGEYKNNNARTGLVIAALVILALIAGLILTNNNTGPQDIEPAAGDTQIESSANNNTTGQ